MTASSRGAILQVTIPTGLYLRYAHLWAFCFLEVFCIANDKPFLTIEQQIALLKKRKLNIPENQIEDAKNFLLNNNYYRVSGYTLTLRKNDEFYPKASFDNIKQIYQFDKRLRHSILSLTEEIEVRVKSMLAYYHSQKYGPMGYKDVNTFHCAEGNKVDAEAISNFLTVQKRRCNNKIE